jgi:lysozyme family protein
MSSNFDFAFEYVCGSEGAYSNDAADRGGVTYWGISQAARRDHRCPDHPKGVRDDAFTSAADRGKELAKHIYRLDYWRFDGIGDPRLAAKLFDIVVNVGNPIQLIQREFGVKQTGFYGPLTEAALTAGPAEEAIERLSLAVGDKYVDLARNDAVSRMRKHGVPDSEVRLLLLTFLKGWTRRAIRRPSLPAQGGA